MKIAAFFGLIVIYDTHHLFADVITVAYFLHQHISCGSGAYQQHTGRVFSIGLTLNQSPDSPIGKPAEKYQYPQRYPIENIITSGHPYIKKNHHHHLYHSRQCTGKGNINQFRRSRIGPETAVKAKSIKNNQSYYNNYRNIL